MPSIEELNRVYLQNGASSSSDGTKSPDSSSVGGVAIIGMGCRLPGSATDPSAFWDMLERKETAASKIPPNRFDVDKFFHPQRGRPGSMTTAGGYMLRDDPTLFEPQLFSMKPTEAAEIDPALKKLLEVVFETIESAGISMEKLAGSDTGCYIGSFNHDELFGKVRDSQFAGPYTATAAIAPFLANRISYTFDLRGPSMTVDTACSASLYALHLACQAITIGEIESAILASSNLIWSPDMQMFLDKLGALSSTSQCHVFGSDADGYGRGDGFVGFYLKDLGAAIRDNDNIQAVIRGTAANANGRTGGITHPSPKAQEGAMRKAYKMAGNFDPRETAYYECHGTGTAVGDPIELQAIQSFFSARDRGNPLLLGSLKANIGHGEPVSGLSGLLKAVLAIQRGVIPPMITSPSINPHLNLDTSRFHLVTEPMAWPVGLPRRASVATSGFGGANAHVIVEQFVSSCGLQNAEIDRNIRPSRFLLPFSAHKPESLACNFEALAAACMKSTYSPADVAYTLGRRSLLPYKGFAVGPTNPDSSLSLSSDQLQIAKRLRTTAPRIGFVFTGQGAQWPQMGKELFGRWPVFQRAIRRMNKTLQQLPDKPPWTLEEILLAPAEESQVYVAEVSQPTCTAVQIGLVDVLSSWDVIPNACMGHSSGEMAAAYAAGRVTLDDAITAAYYRGKSVARITRDGSMAALGLTPKDCDILLEPLKGRAGIAAVNSPESVTVSGDTNAVQEIIDTCSSTGIFNRGLSTGGKAYHSSHMQEIGEMFETSTQQATSYIYSEEGKRVEAPFFSSVSGQRLPDDFEITPSYWRLNLESPVLFSPTLEELVNHGVDLLVEIGPHSALTGPIRQLEQAFRGKGKEFPSYLPTLIRKRDAEECMLELAGAMFNNAYDINLEAINCAFGAVTAKPFKPKLLTSLPTYRYTYGDSKQEMSRIEKEFRFPQFSFHNLLGSRLLGASPRAPSWRNVFGLDKPQDIMGFKVSQTTHVPAACLLEMVIVAIQQTYPSSSSVTWSFTNIHLPNALSLETEKDVVTSLYPDGDQESFFFEITSVQDQKSTVHAAGCIHGRSDLLNKDGILNGRLTPIEISGAKLYQKMENIGIEYDAPWQLIEIVHVNPLENSFRCELKESSLGRIGTLEGCIQLAIMASATLQQPQHQQLAYPISIGKFEAKAMWESLDLSVSYLTFQQQGGEFVKVIELWDRNNQLVACLEDVCLKAMHASASTLDYPALQSIWKPDYTSATRDSISNMFPTPVFPGEKTFSMVHKLASAMVVQYICSQANSSSKEPLQSLPETGQAFLEWLQNVYAQIPNGSMPHGQEIKAMDPSTRAELISTLYEEVAQESVEAQLMMRMYSNFAGVLDGSTSAHSLLMSDGLLHKLYTSTLTAAGSIIQLRRVIDLIGHKNPGARYLEIGGGTAGATREILDVLGARGGGRRYGSYHFTDVSSYFLSGARDEFQDCQAISYGTLNIEESPSKQGIEEGSYDVVVAANVLHATASLEETLRNVRKVLKPNGKLVLVETTIETVWLTIVLGGFSDYWKGRRDGRPTSPFIPVHLWNQTLTKCGFTSIQIDLPDYADPFKTMDVLVSSVADDSLNCQLAGSGSNKRSIERLYPVTPSIQTEGTIFDTNSYSNSVVLVDCIGEPFFAEMTTWLVKMGTRSLIILQSRKERTEDSWINETVLYHIESLRQLGISVSVVWEPLTIAHENKVSMQLRVALPQCVNLVIFGRQYADSDAEDLHSVAQRVFSGRWAPGKVLIFDSADASSLVLSARTSDNAHRIADSWEGKGSACSLLSLFDCHPPFDDLIPAMETLLCSTKISALYSAGPPHAQSMVYGLSSDAAYTITLEQEKKASPQSQEIFSIVLQTAAARRTLTGANTTNGQSVDPIDAAKARFRSISVEDTNSRHSAAVDVVAAILAELLFIPQEQISMQTSLTKIGIDSLIASELRHNLDDAFRKDVSTGWLLSGEVKGADIVDAVLNTTY